jgi:carboxypeptidase PM20D1
VVKRALWLLLGVLLLLAAAVGINTWRQGSRQVGVPPAPPLAVDERAVADRLAGAIRFKTISSYDDARLSEDQFRGLHAYLQQNYPRVHASLEREVVGNLSLLYKWPGSDPKAPPILLMAHQDVVRISPGTEATWQAQPFGGEQKGGFVWGRGAWDDKSNLVSQLEAVETLLASGFQPRQTIYLAYGADEEVGGYRGAQQIAKVLQSRGVKLDFVIDEGLVITDDVLPGLSHPAALVGVAEKGSMSVVLRASAPPGHSSMPPPPGTGAIAVMATALRRLEDHQMPGGIRGVGREMLETLAPEMSGLSRVALSNLWLFEPVVRAQLDRSPSTSAMLRTTTALTVMNAGNQHNVLPGFAQAVVNFRLLPGDTEARMLQHVRDTVADERIGLTAIGENYDPPPPSPTDSASFQLINRTVRAVFPGTLVAPGLMIGGTDSRHFSAISRHIYRFSPVRARPEDLPRFHGTNERIATANLAEMVRFYHQLLRNASAAVSP